MLKSFIYEIKNREIRYLLVLIGERFSEKRQNACFCVSPFHFHTFTLKSLPSPLKLLQIHYKILHITLITFIRVKILKNIIIVYIMKKPINLTFDLDAAAITLLDHYRDGEYAYEDGEKKTDKQRNLKREFKTCLDNMAEHNELFRKSFCEAINELFNLCDTTRINRLKEENKTIRNKLNKLQEEKDNRKACYLAQEQDDWRHVFFTKMRGDDADTINTLRKSIKACREEIQQLKDYKHLYETAPKKEELNSLRQINQQLTGDLYNLKRELNKKSKPKDTELQKKIEAKRKKMEQDKKELEVMMSKSNSEDNISESFMSDSDSESEQD